MYKKIYLIITLLIIISVSGFAQSVTNYNFTSTAGTFTALSGATSPALSSGNADEGNFNNLPLGFDFFYLGTRYTTVSASTNGWLTLNGPIGIVNESTSLSGSPTATGVRPVLAPLWDNLSLQAATNFSYLTTGTAGSRIFTVQYLNVKWNPAAAGASISFQVQLYESSGKIEFCYRPEASAAISADAGIGITALATGSGNFLSVNDAGTAVSSTIETSVFTRPTSGKTYGFVPAVPTAPTLLTFSAVTTTSLTLKWSDNSNNEVAFAIYRSTNGINYTYVSQVSSIPDSSVQTRLAAGSTYYWRVYAVTEGGMSSAVTGTQATLPCPAAPVVTSPVNYCLNATPAQLSATGTSLAWGSPISGSVSGSGTLTTSTYVDNASAANNKKVNFTTTVPNVTITTVDYYIAANQNVNSLVLAIYNNSGVIIATSTTSTSQTAGGTAVMIRNTLIII